MAEGRAVVDDGTRLWFEVSGRGAPLLLCHGGPGLWDDLGPLADLLADDAQVVRWEQRGCGRSDRRGPYTVARMVADLDQLRAHLGHEQWTVGGHSWGATLALRYALTAPERVNGLVYMSGVGLGRDWNAAYHEEADRRLTAEQRDRRDELRNIDRDDHHEREYRALCWAPDFADRRRALDLAWTEASVPWVTNYEANRALSDEVNQTDEHALVERCRQLEVPSLVIHGELDPRPTWALTSLVSALPRAELHVLAGAGHLPWIERPGATADLVRTFVNRDLLN